VAGSFYSRNGFIYAWCRLWAISTVNIYPNSLFPYTLLQPSPLNSRRNSCKPLAELRTRENMSFTDECLCVITKAHPKLTESFVGAADLCKDAAHRFRNPVKVPKIWCGSNAIIIRTNKRLAVFDVWLRPPRTFPTGPASRVARFDWKYTPSPW
jgi:hypothetical protein